MSPPTRVNAGGASAGGVGHSSTSAGSAQDLFHALHPRRLIPELCHLFYHQGWFSGTGGGVSIKQGSNIYVAPSGVQKERLEHDDLFLLKGDGSIAQSPPQEKNLSLSQCTPLFMNAYQERNANAVIHSHGKYIVLASLIYTGPEFRIKNLEMIKGIHHPLENRAFRYDEEIIVPIIENTCFEADLKDSMLDAMKRYPTSNAVMVRRHGIYVWGKSWQQCKAMAECYHYLCEMAVEMERLGINEYTHHNEAIVPTVLSKPITPVTPKAESTPAPNSTVTVPDTPKTPVSKDNGTTSNGTPNNKPAASPKKTPNTEGKAKLNGVKGGKVTKPKNNKQQGNKWNNRKSPAGARGGPGGPGGSGGPQMGGVPSPWGPPIPGLMGMGPMMGPMGPMMPPHPGMFGPGGPPSGGQNSGGRNGRGGGRGGGSGRGRGSKKQGGATTPKNTNDKNKTPNQRGGGAKGRGRGNKLGMSKNTIMNY